MTSVVLRGITWDHVRGFGGLRAAAEAYREVRPDVQVEWTARSLQAFADQPLDELARHFDLLYVDHPAIGEAAARACLVPLDEHLDPETGADQDMNSVGRSAESYVWKGHRYALATDAAAQVAAYRPDLMKQAGRGLPRTWPEVIELADALIKHGLRVAMPAIPVDAICTFLAVGSALGEEPFERDGIVFSRGVGRDALGLLRDVVTRAHPASLEWSPPRLLEHMAEDDDVAYCPMAFGYVNYARPGFRRHVVRFSPPPAGAEDVPRGTLGGAGLAVSAFSQAVDDAVAHAAFIADGAIQRGPYVDGGGQPGHRSAWIDAAVNAAAGGFFGDTLSALEAAYLRPRYDGFLRFQEAGGSALHALLRERRDPAATLDQLDQAYRESRMRERV